MKYLKNDPNILNGTTVIVNTRIPISRIIFLLKQGYMIEEICDQYPQLTKITINHALDEASLVLDRDIHETHASV